MASSSFADRSDENLVALFRQGDQDAFGALVRRYEGVLYGYLRRYLDDSELADDVFQNTFLQLYTKIHQFEPGRPFRPWLYAIATNQAIDAQRRERRHQTVPIEQDRDEDADAPHLLGMLECPGPAPLELLQTAERRQQVRASVENLPDYLKQVVILAYYQELKYSDISTILRIPVGTVKSRMHTALIKLQEAWSAELTAAD